MRVLVTGATSYLGQHIVAQLAERGDIVTTFQRSSFDGPGISIKGSINDSDAISKAMANQQAVIHLAAKVAPLGSWKDFYSIKNLNYITKIIRSSSLVSKDYHGVEVFLKTRLKKLQKKEDHSIYCFEYWELVYFYAHALYRLKKIKEAKVVLKEVNLERGNLIKSKKSELACKIELLNWACEFYGGNIKAGIQRLLIHESGTDFENNVLFDLDRKLNLITSFFASGEHSRGIGVINSIKHSAQWLQKKKGLEWRVKFQLIEMLCFYETGKIDLVLNRIRALRRIIKDVVKLNPNYKNLNVFLNVINSSINNGGFKGLEKDLEKFELTPFRRENIQAMAFYAYLKSKVNNKDYYTTLVDLVTTEWKKG